MLSNRYSDGLVFKYDMSFDAEYAVTSSYAPLLHGNYVFIRHHHRLDQIPWHEFTLNHKTGKLKYACDVWLKGDEKESNCIDTNKPTCGDCVQLGKKGDDYKQFTYFTINISRNEEAFEQDMMQTILDFRAQPAANKYDFSSLPETFKKFRKTAIQKALFDALRSDLDKLPSSPPLNVAKTHAAIAKHICNRSLTDLQRDYILRGLGKIKGLDPRKLTLKSLNTECMKLKVGENFYNANKLFELLSHVEPKDTPNST